jgi:fimbrial chaperone protein
MRIPRRALFLGALSLLSVGFPFTTFAASFNVAPSLVALDSDTRRAALTVTNSGDEQVIIQLQLMKWSQDEQGRDVYEPTKGLVFYPQILTLEAGKAKVVRVGYEEAVVPAEEMTYRLFLQDLPVKKPGENTLQISLRVAIPIFLAPRQSAQKLSVESIQIAEGKLQVRVRNSGNNHFLAQEIKVTGLDEKGSEVFAKGISGWYILPRILRSFPVEIFREDCQKVKTLKVSVTGGSVSLAGQLTVDQAATAQLAGRHDKKPQDENKLLTPAAR